MKGVIYVRVSSEEQVKGTSLDEQKRACRDYCKNIGIEIVDVFCEEGESAKNLKLNNRKEFLRALEFCRKNKGKITAFVVHKVDRFARNTDDHFVIRKTLLDYGVTLHSVTEPIGNKPVEKFFETILAGAAEFDNAIRRQRCCDGQSARINQGIYPHKCPIGYVSGRCKSRGEKKTEPDLPDEKIFPIIQRGLREFKKGTVSKTDLADLLDQWGLSKLRSKRTTVQFVEKMFTQHLKFYAGTLLNPYTGETIKGLHEPMISENEMREIQFVLGGKNKHCVKKNRYNPNFPLRRTVLCSTCGEPLTGSSPRGNGGRYFYYHCRNRNCTMYGKAILKTKIENDFLEHLNLITPKAEYLELFKATVIDLWNEKSDMYKSEIDRQRKLIEELEHKRQRIFEMREDDSYTLEEFSERRDKVDNMIAAEKITLNETRIDQLDVEAVLSFAIQFIKDLSRQWFDMPEELRPRFQKLVFPQGISYNREKGFGTAKLGTIYEGAELLARKKYPLVEQRGIEPLSEKLLHKWIHKLREYSCFTLLRYQSYLT